MPIVIQMSCDRLPQVACRHAHPAGRPQKTERSQTAAGITPSIILSPSTRSSTELRPGARAHAHPHQHLHEVAEMP
jgi:hypothetical protein